MSAPMGPFRASSTSPRGVTCHSANICCTSSARRSSVAGSGPPKCKWDEMSDGDGGREGWRGGGGEGGRGKGREGGREGGGRQGGREREGGYETRDLNLVDIVDGQHLQHGVFDAPPHRARQRRHLAGSCEITIIWGSKITIIWAAKLQIYGQRNYNYMGSEITNICAAPRAAASTPAREANRLVSYCASLTVCRYNYMGERAAVSTPAKQEKPTEATHGERPMSQLPHISVLSVFNSNKQYIYK